MPSTPDQPFTAPLATDPDLAVSLSAELAPGSLLPACSSTVAPRSESCT